MSIRFDTQDAGIGGILFDEQDAFVGVSGVFAATTGGMVMAASGATSGVYTDIFDIELNISPQYGEQYYEGATGTFAATTGAMVMVANEGIVISGAFAATTGAMVMSAAGFHILPIYGTFAATTGAMIMTAGAAALGVDVSDVVFRSEFATNVVIRDVLTSNVTIH